MTRKTNETPIKAKTLRPIPSRKDQASTMESAIERGAMKRLATETLNSAQVHLENIRKVIEAMPSIKRPILNEVSMIEIAAYESFKAVAYGHTRGRPTVSDYLLDKDDLLEDDED